ncbi:hypothetical protein N0V83_002705 [Neocucurbitaria cava]|uniref:RRM domain-containing protein n=1 Tax=Neocucurbitaria cava TaxID=798079 RepID=A0A9W9CNY2_9PLEO|nr:hypothetical protein N0V83_002705 [Neocucurbitaria cava]
MSKTKEEKKRKRDVEATEDVPKKSKRSKKTEDVLDAPATEAPVVEAKKEKKDKKDKKAKKVKDAEAEADIEEAPKEKKEKKSKSKKSKKADDVTESAPADEVELIHDMKATENFIGVTDDDEPMPDAPEETESKASKKDKKSKKDKDSKKDKKSKKSKTSTESETVSTGEAEEQNGVSEEAVADTNGADTEAKVDKKEKKKSKKDKEAKKAKKEKKSAKSETNGDVPTEEQPVVETNGEAEAEEQNAEEDAEEGETEGEGKKGRFIVFVGNLPYSATKEQIEEHFAKIKPTEIRLRTYKGTNKFMGTCFVEFDRFDRMETCLKKYHHSLFPDGKKKSEGRKINVELSAGGGGNSEARKTKIMKQAERKDKKASKQKKGEAEPAAGEPEKAAEPDNGYINPARLAMMSRPAPPTHRQRY